MGWGQKERDQGGGTATVQASEAAGVVAMGVAGVGNRTDWIS